jgi:hypothetical protein
MDKYTIACTCTRMSQPSSKAELVRSLMSATKMSREGVYKALRQGRRPLNATLAGIWDKTVAAHTMVVRVQSARQAGGGRGARVVGRGRHVRASRSQHRPAGAA